MADIKEIRISINEIDKEMASLFEKRLKLSEEVANYKKERGLPIYDKVRENEVINKNVQLITNDIYKGYYVDFLKYVMDVSKRYQYYLIETLKIAYSGIEGSFAHIACMNLYPNAIYKAYPSFDEAYDAVIKGEADLCCLPIENSYAGDVGNVMDLIFQGDLYINRIYELNVTHCLLGVKGAKLEDVKTVISHPQALMQCNEYIKNKKFNVIEGANTALCAKRVSVTNDKSIASIASIENAKLYNLEVLDHHLNTSNTNTTRFAIFSKVLNDASTNKMGEHFILVFTVKNEAGSLAKTLNIIGSHGYNMRNLRSRPLKGLMWNYYFFIELEGNINSSEGKEMLRELNTICDRLKLVGTYNL